METISENVDKTTNLQKTRYASSTCVNYGIWIVSILEKLIL